MHDKSNIDQTYKMTIDDYLILTKTAKKLSTTIKMVNHLRLKSEAWWLSRKSLARTPTNLDRNNLTKSSRNLTSGYLITKAINPRVARRIIQFSIVV